MTTFLVDSFNLLLAADAADPPLQIKIDTMIFSLLIFVILILVLWKFAWNPIMEGLEKREKSIADNIDSARQANDQAQALLAQYDQKLAAASEEVARLIAEAKEDGNRQRDRIVAEAKEAAAKEQQKVLAEIATAKDQAVRELAERSVDSAVSLAQSMLGRELDRNSHAKLIEQSLQRFAKTDQFSKN
ncbi:MAG TPA: F0F1 ATP synthase subunit B [Pirellulaceae bacterium]|nr:F0F1 ATP synthase subunit B [Pirellulaceae bacterium]HMO91286.1 F0F1 ATP synthase subunit B [Pirellulaceae bacterium]HMP68530.1 F0F1 ATP synthase subunit B [Pirellulaceae bacterium]